MSDSTRWDRDTLPDGLYVSDDGRAVLIPTSVVQRWEPTPYLTTEVALWEKPASGLAFPYHSAGAAELYKRADELLENTGVYVGMSDEEAELMGKRLWACASILYAPGVSVRSALDAFATANYLPNLASLDGEDRAHVKGPSLLAAWAVARAACEWVREGV